MLMTSCFVCATLNLGRKKSTGTEPLVVFKPYRDLEAGDNQSLKFKWQDWESNLGHLAPQAKSLTT